MNSSESRTPKGRQAIPVKKRERAKVIIADDQGGLSRDQHVRPNIRTKIWVELDGRFVIGEGGIALLSAVAARGSLAEGARHIGWSYRHAWGYIRRAEATLGTSLTATRPGKGGSRGTALTEAGRRIVEQLLRIRHRLDGALGSSGPSPREIAARGRRRSRGAA